MQMQQVFRYVFFVFQGCLSWAYQVFDAIEGAFGTFLTAFSIYVIVQLLIMPIRGGRSLGGADKARKVKSNKQGKGG